jgi:hypothetical protein
MYNSILQNMNEIRCDIKQINRSDIARSISLSDTREAKSKHHPGKVLLEPYGFVQTHLKLKIKSFGMDCEQHPPSLPKAQ